MEKFIQPTLHLIFTVALGYLLLCVALFLLQEKMIFFTPSIDGHSYNRFKENQITVNQQHHSYHGWRIPVDSSATKTMVYFGGNAEDVVMMNYESKEFNVKQVFAFNYPGYGYSKGRAGEKEIYQYANEILDYIKVDFNIPENEILLVGRSLGSSVASYLAARNKVAGLIMITPFDSLLSVAKQHYAFLPVQLLLKHNFPTIEYIKKIHAPVIQVSAQNDEIISVSQSELNRIKKNNIKQVVLENVGHNTIQSHRDYYHVMNNFIQSL